MLARVRCTARLGPRVVPMLACSIRPFRARSFTAGIPLGLMKSIHAGLTRWEKTMLLLANFDGLGNLATVLRKPCPPHSDGRDGDTKSTTTKAREVRFIRANFYWYLKAFSTPDNFAFISSHSPSSVLNTVIAPPAPTRHNSSDLSSGCSSSHLNRV
jgi:hypothetical protein